MILQNMGGLSLPNFSLVLGASRPHETLVAQAAP
jgi:hypothetical protein